MSDHQKVVQPAAFVVDAETLRTIVREAVGDALVRYGLDGEDAKEVRVDLAYLRRWRTTMDQVRNESLAAAVKWATIALISAVLVGLGYKFGILRAPF